MRRNRAIRSRIAGRAVVDPRLLMALERSAWLGVHTVIHDYLAREQSVLGVLGEVRAPVSCGSDRASPSVRPIHVVPSTSANLVFSVEAPLPAPVDQEQGGAD